MATDTSSLSGVQEDSPPAIAPSLRTVAMPADTNPGGDIFGGWILSQMDLAGGIHAYAIAGGRVATVAVTGMKFLKPVLVGDDVSVYCETERTGNTSVSVNVETWVCRRHAPHDDPHKLQEKLQKVTEGLFTYVAIDQNRKPRPLVSGCPDSDSNDPDSSGDQHAG